MFLKNGGILMQKWTDMLLKEEEKLKYNIEEHPGIHITSITLCLINSKKSGDNLESS